MSFAMYPFPVFEGVAKIILLTLIPAGFITGVPVGLLQNFDAKWFWLSLLIAGFFMAFSIAVFKHGLKKYESGSMFTVRV